VHLSELRHCSPPTLGVGRGLVLYRHLLQDIFGIGISPEGAECDAELLPETTLGCAVGELPGKVESSAVLELGLAMGKRCLRLIAGKHGVRQRLLGHLPSKKVPGQLRGVLGIGARVQLAMERLESEARATMEQGASMARNAIVHDLPQDRMVEREAVLGFGQQVRVDGAFQSLKYAALFPRP
jgi:hypothetical protein